MRRHRASTIALPAESLIIPAEAALFGLRLTESAPIHAGVVQADHPTDPDYDMHFGVELGVVMSGRMRRYWREWQTELAPGQVWHCGVWEPHGWQVLVAPCQHLVLVILPEVLVNTGLFSDPRRDWLAPFRALPEHRPQAHGRARQRVLWLAHQICLRAGSDQPQARLWLRLLTLELLMTLQRQWSQSHHPPAPPPSSLDSLRRAVDLVLSAKQMVTVSQAAAAAGMSASAFSRAFRKLTGVSFAKFALRHRLGQAAQQLLRTQDPIKAVAHHWGFTDDSHLHRCFLRHYGCSPGDYRRRRRSPAPR